MTVGQWLDAQIELVLASLPQERPKHIHITLAVGLIPLALFHLYLRFIYVPESQRTARFEWPIPPEAAPGWRGKTLSSPSIHSHNDDPSLLPSTKAPSYITCYAPASGHHLETIPSHTADEIRASISRAEVAQKDWGKSSFDRRRKVLKSLLEWCVRDMEAIARISSRDTGKTLVDAAFGEVLTTCEKLRWTIANGEDQLKPESRPTNLILAHKVSEVRYEPLGVVAAIVSWNYSFHNALSPIIASLFTGNAIILKASENVAWASHHYIRAVRSCLEACGESPELVQIVTCLPDAVEALTGDTRIKHITFIGSEQVGQKVALKGAEVGTPVLLELGGKDPCIILPSADVKFFTATWMRAAFQAAGQNCIGVERFLVHSSIYSSFITDMTSRVSDLRVGDVLAHAGPEDKSKRIDVGAMVTDRLFDELEGLIAEAVSQGARCLFGGKRIVHEEFPSGHYFAPTLLVDVTPSMRIATQEIFAPVMTVLKYDTLEEAVSIANGTRYGLGASVFGKNKQHCQYIVDNIQSGMVCTNDFGVFYLNQSLPFGGCKASGYGRFAGREGLRGLTNAKAVTVDRFHGWVQTGIPPLLAYPIKSGEGAWKFVGGLVGMVYGKGVAGKAKGLWDLATAKA
ncbi:putative meiotic recombination-related protein [Leucosporidium creatinivorum]|uniref:Putative meiotic recombination-related protein n=1 Tax=Leucosporidium creatinivorum TaxID=106004 RepID=A0A1Y2CY11_9BASI|nr:putative meiotic recombination-related protein [Leucosporidium creatinivorum]